MHSIYLPNLDPEATNHVIEGEEAKHAVRVKRLGPGDPLMVLDGAGTVARARVIDTKGRLVVEIVSRELAPRVRPAVHVYSATPKGPRVAELVEGLVQVGAAAWSPMQTKLGVVDPRDSKLARLERVALEACKQARRAWMMTIGEKASFAEALAAPVGAALVLADGSGEPYVRPGAEVIRLLVGPEGGFRGEEIDAARRAGARVASFGPHIMRIETAAPVAAAIVIAAQR